MNFRWLSVTVLLASVVHLTVLFITAVSILDQLYVLSVASRKHLPLYQRAYFVLGIVLMSVGATLPLTAWREAGDLCAILNEWRGIAVRPSILHATKCRAF